MDLTNLAIIAVLLIVAVTALAPRIGIAAPLGLVAAGVALSFLPGIPEFEVDPELILAGVLPPLLYSAAVNMPTMDFRRDLKSIGGLSFVVVVVSAGVIGFVLNHIVPGIGFAEGFALGAIVSPTDAVATGIVKKTGVAPRLVTVLEGESMLNDASALVLLRSAVAAMGVAAGSISVGGVLWDFVVAVALAVVVGVVVGGASLALRAVVRDATLQTAISFVVPFIAYVPAEHVGASGLVAVVTAGLITGYRGTIELRPQDRLSEAATWRTIAFLLESGVFLLMGLEVRPLIDDFTDDGGSVLRLLTVVGTCLGILLIVRAGYIALLIKGLGNDLRHMRRWLPHMARMKGLLDSPAAQRMSERRRERIRQEIVRHEADLTFYRDQQLGRRDGAVLTWAGMRGVVTLAAAQTLPVDTDQRALLVLAAFTVAVTSLVVQGGTLAWIVRLLGTEARRDAEVRQQLATIADTLTEIADDRCAEVEESGLDGREVDADALAHARRYNRLDRDSRWAGPEGEDRDRRLADLQALRRAVLSDQRDALVEMRSLHRYDSEALTTMLDRVDRAELAVDALN